MSDGLPGLGDQRDVGPFRDWLQAKTQFNNEMAGHPDVIEAGIVVLHAATMAGVEISPFERDMISAPDEGWHIHPVTATIFAGLVYRAWRAGLEQGRASR